MHGISREQRNTWTRGLAGASLVREWACAHCLGSETHVLISDIHEKMSQNVPKCPRKCPKMSQNVRLPHHPTARPPSRPISRVLIPTIDLYWYDPIWARNCSKLPGNLTYQIFTRPCINIGNRVVGRVRFANSTILTTTFAANPIFLFDVEGVRTLTQFDSRFGASAWCRECTMH